MAKILKLAFLKMMLVACLINNGQLTAQDTTFSILDTTAVKDTTFILLNNFAIQAEYITVDKLQNIYVLTPDNQLLKHNSSGQLLFKYNNETYGKPSAIDVSNPLRPFLYFKDYLKGIVLDRTLNELYEYDLNLFGVDAIVSVAAPSPDNGLWLFDDIQFKLKKYSQQGQLLYESNDISQLIGKGIEPNHIIVKEDKIILQEEKKIYFFDRFGQFSFEIEQTNSSQTQIEGNWLIGFQEDTNQLIFSLSLASKIIKVNLPKLNTPSLQTIKSGSLIFIRTNEKIFIYRYQP